MPRPRCLWCTDPPFQETAVLKWRGEERERLTVQLCRKHLSRLREAGQKGREIKGWWYKDGWW
ncbi:MAG TPA: hypothetical protein PKA49_16175 [Tepidiformaceae bacterium]|jgi:hypothetical protein|nr:hypothetical protein [Tepidiformaceae bacterium]